jgi:hypothetical protein
MNNKSEDFAIRHQARANIARNWLKHYDRISLVVDRIRIALGQVQEEEDFPPPMRIEVLSLLAELFAYKQVVEERKRCLAYLAEGKTENDPAPDPKKLGSHLKFVKALSEIIRAIEGESLVNFRENQTFLDNFHPNISYYKSDDSFWLWKAERKAYALRKTDVLPVIREARFILTGEEDNRNRFSEIIQELKNDPDLCDV